MIIVLLASACKPKHTESCTLEPALYQVADFPIGCAVDLNQLEFNPNYAQLLGQQFNQLSPENLMKAEHIHPQVNTYNWSEADRLVNYCQQESKSLHGHTLIWHQQLPTWMEHFSGTKSEWEAMFKDHIQSMCRHFKGKVRAWDVVNEAFNEDGTLRNSIWKQHLGAGYIEKAFRYAHEADPDALLFYNDFNLVLSPKKREAVLGLLKSLKQRGVPVNGIGLQMHISIAFPENRAMESAFQDFSEAGFLVHISELDISVNPYGGALNNDSNLWERQAQKLAVVLSLYKQIDHSRQYGITFWGLSDADSWIPSAFNREDYPLLFDVNYQAKAAYCKMKESL
ncbi:endo-1,4-beta-xylanase [Croceimicrobium sp.]|uniref:endo-1,4-beta-xylanase n=1 Tax=Croceimicrobium sp. TaxID=2828340 RepID=UPI003BAC0A68